jgi:hypothetical protein
MIDNYLNNCRCPGDIHQSYLDRYTCTKRFGQKNIKLTIFDGTDEASLAEDRQKLYKIMDGFLVCVSVSDHKAWNEV